VPCAWRRLGREEDGWGVWQSKSCASVSGALSCRVARYDLRQRWHFSGIGNIWSETHPGLIHQSHNTALILTWIMSKPPHKHEYSPR
jgi:hypothetical protein